MKADKFTGLSVPSAVLPLHNIKAKYRTFLSVPASLRPKGLQTVREFAEHFRIQASLLKQWESEPTFWDDVFGEAKAVLGRAMADIMASLAARAMAGNVNAIKLSLEVLGVHHDKMEVQQTRTNDQIIMVLPPGMEIPTLPNYTSQDQLDGEAGVLTQTHIDESMDFIIDQPPMEEQQSGGTLEDTFPLRPPKGQWGNHGKRVPDGLQGERLDMYRVATRPRDVDDAE